MIQYEYRVLPAPTKGQKAAGAKTPESRFAAAIETCLNDEATDGWEFVRAETLPSTERQGLTGTKTVFQNILVFRRAIGTPDLEQSAHRQDAEPPLTADPAAMPASGELIPTR